MTTPETNPASSTTQQQQPAQPAPAAPREPDELDMLASNLLALQSSLTTLGSLVYGSLVHVRRLQREREGGTAPTDAGPLTRSALGLGPVNAGTPGETTVRVVTPPPSTARFNRRGPSDENLATAAQKGVARGVHPDTIAADRSRELAGLAAQQAAANDSPAPESPAPESPAPPAPATPHSPTNEATP